MMHKQRELVLIPIPFTDLSSQRRRPVIIISNDDYNSKTDDIIVVGVTSNLQETEYSLTITQNDMESGTLRQTSRVKVDKIYTLAQSIVVRSFGKIKIQTFDKILDLLKEVTTPPAESD